MVVVQLLAAEKKRPRHDVRRRRRHLEAAVAQAMTDAIDHAAGEEWFRGDVNGHHHDAGHTEQNKLGKYEENETRRWPAAIEVALNPVIRRTAAVVIKDLRVRSGRLIELIALKNDLLQPENGGAVWVAGLIGEGMVAPVYGDPLSRDCAGAEPEPEPEDMAQCGMQF